MAPYDSSSRALATQRPQSAMTVDNLFRRVLKVANPRDPDEVAKALLARYTDDAALIKREQSGVPFSAYQFAEQAMRGSGPLSSEIHQATDDLARDLGALVSDIQLKDIAPELRGLANAVRNAAGMGLDAARLALDPAQRDRAFAARRTLGDYSRIVRLLGALTACATALYCRVAQSIDLNANLILVSMGEALAAAGVTKSGGLLQVPASELQTRRDAVIGALRRLLGQEADVVLALGTALGTANGATGPAAGSAAAVTKITSALEARGAQDLRSLLDESYVANLLDDLLDRATANSPDGLRTLGSSAAVTSQVLTRFVSLIGPLGRQTDAQDRVAILDTLIDDYVVALSAIASGFGSTQIGYRLPFLARPPLLSYGLYGVGGADTGTGLLQELAVKRTQFAELVDCLCCNCGGDAEIAAALAAKLIYDIDRAIDLIALGETPDATGRVEAYAAAYAFVIAAAVPFEDVERLRKLQKKVDEDKEGWLKAKATAETRLTEATKQQENRARTRFEGAQRKLAAAIEELGRASVIFRSIPGAIPILTDVCDRLRNRLKGGDVLIWGKQIVPGQGNATANVAKALVPVLRAQRDDEIRWRDLARRWTPICDQDEILGTKPDGSDAATIKVVDDAILLLRHV